METEKVFPLDEIAGLLDERTELYARASKINAKLNHAATKLEADYKSQINRYGMTLTSQTPTYGRFERDGLTKIVNFHCTLSSGYIIIPVEILIDEEKLNQYVAANKEKKLEVARKELQKTEEKFLAAQRKLNKLKAAD